MDPQVRRRLIKPTANNAWSVSYSQHGFKTPHGAGNHILQLTDRNEDLGVQVTTSHYINPSRGNSFHNILVALNHPFDGVQTTIPVHASFVESVLLELYGPRKAAIATRLSAFAIGKLTGVADVCALDPSYRPSLELRTKALVEAGRADDALKQRLIHRLQLL